MTYWHSIKAGEEPVRNETYHVTAEVLLRDGRLVRTVIMDCYYDPEAEVGNYSEPNDWVSVDTGYGLAGDADESFGDVKRVVAFANQIEAYTGE